MNQTNVNALLSDNAGYLVMQNQTKPLVAKWKKTGLLEGLSNEFETNGMAVMLENQARELIKEATSTNNSGTSNAEAWSGVALPLVRRIFGEISSKEFVSVQPMNLPSGLIFYLDFKYSSNGSQPGFTAGTSLFGGSSTAKFGTTDAAVNGLYGAGRFGNTINEVSGGVVIVSTASVASIDLNYDTRFDSITGSYKTVLINTSSFTSGDLNAIRGYVPQTSGSQVVGGYLPAYTKLTGSNVQFIVSGAGWTPSTNLFVNWFVQTTQDARGDFEDLHQPFSSGTTDIATAPYKIPQLEIQMKSEAIVAKTRKLKAQWTPEMAQDLNAYHSIDAEAELTSILSEYISMEIDLEILDMLITNALTTEQWSVVNNQYFDGSTWQGTGGTTGLGFYNQQGTWFSTLGTKLKKVSNKIHQLTMRGGANFMVISPDVATILDSIPGYAASDRGEKMKFAMGVQKAGQMSNQYDVYINPYMTENQILMGFRGSQFLETGAVYAPYIPLALTPLVYDPETYTPNRGVMTRYAKKMVRPEFYGIVKVKGLETI